METKNNGCIFVCGDTHGVLDSKKIERLKLRHPLTYDDYIIICGDAGIVWDKDTIKDTINYYNNFGTNILFVDGNHENFDLLNSYKVEMFNGGKVHKIAENIFHLMRGQVYTLLGKTILTMGGASSHDKNSRQPHISWWEDEEITYADLIEANENLQKYNNTVDYVISHTQPSKVLDELVENLTACGESVPYFLQPKLNKTQSNMLLDELDNNIQYKKWFSGHLHIDEYIKNHIILYENIFRLN